MISAGDNDNYIRGGGYVIIRVSCLSVCEQDYGKSIQAIFVKPCTIMVYRYGKNPLNFGIDPAQNGQMAAILDSRYKYIAY